MPTIADLMARRDQLQAISDTPGLDVELLLGHCLQKPRSYLKAWSEQDVGEEPLQQFQALMSRRQQGEPIAYLIGECGFWNLDLYTDASTLIPRPDTELLVEEALRVMAGREEITALDLGTGTGAIALALAGERPQWQLLACDVQKDAVALAQRNRQRWQRENVSIIQSDWFSQVPRQHFQLIVSNPPYIDPQDPHLLRGDVRFEPASALVAENEGFADLDYIIQHAGSYLVEGGWLLLEHGFDQAEGVRQRFMRAGYTAVYTARDLAGHERVSGGCMLAGPDAAMETE